MKGGLYPRGVQIRCDTGKQMKSLKGVDRLVRLLSFACAFKSSDLKTWLLLRNVLMTFLCDVIIRVSFLSFPCLCVLEVWQSRMRLYYKR